MPMYEYCCRKCGESFEELVRGPGDEEGLACPACGEREPERCLSACAVRVGVGEGAGGGFAAPAASGGCGCGGFT